VQPQDQALDVWGEFACFTRPELKVERFSYPIITPSAARGIFDAIYSKPNRNPANAEFGWRLTRIEVGAQPSYLALRRNEVKEKISGYSSVSWAGAKVAFEPIWADGDRDTLATGMKGRTQRQTMALRNVRYRLHAEVHPWPGFEDRLPGLEAQFRRRAAGGKCIYQPYFGCREFPAYFELVEPHAPTLETADWDEDIGLMLYDVFDLSRPGGPNDPPCVSLFRAVVRHGVLEVPDYESGQVLKGFGGCGSC
jgi:CRISPR-associated protein Cas5d